MKEMIPISKLLPFIGLSSLDKDFQYLLDEYYIFNKPNKICDSEGYLDYNSTIDSMSCYSERNSLMLKYAEANQYKLLHDIKIPIAGDFVFQELFIFPKSLEFIGYQGDLPFELEFDMESYAVTTKLSNPISVKRLSESIILETFYIANFIVNISYKESKISAIGIRRPDFYDLIYLHRPFKDFPPVNKSLDFDCQKWLPHLGNHFFTQELNDVLPKYSIDNDIELEDCVFCILVDLLKEYGVTLYYNNSYKYQEKLGIKDQGIIFSGFRLTRRGEKYSDGFQGKIPFNLTFSIPIEEVIRNIGSSPDKEDTVGMYRFYTWYFSDYILYINYDLIKNRVVTFSFYGVFMKNYLSQ